MKTKYIILSIILCLCVILPTLSGCASKDTATTPPTEPSEVETPAEDWEEEIPPEELGEWPTDPEVPEGPEEPTEVSGIIALVVSPGGNNMGYKATIMSVDPDTGDTTSVTEFPTTLNVLSTNRDYHYELPGATRFASCSDWVSSDLDKIAVTKMYDTDFSRHAGWIDAEGNFYDVTEAIYGKEQSDFADPISHSAIGFVEGGYFAYYDSTADQFYRVPLEDISSDSVIQELEAPNSMVNMGYGAQYWSTKDYVPTDLIDDVSFIANCEIREGRDAPYTTSVIVNSETKEVTQYIPGNSRFNWSGIISPDGSQVAFLSKPRSGSEASALYIATLSAGDPVRVNATLPNSADQYDRPLTEVRGGCTCCLLIDWR